MNIGLMVGGTVLGLVTLTACGLFELARRQIDAARRAGALRRGWTVERSGLRK